MNKIIRSTYRDSEKEQFEMEILGETIEDNEECYLVRLLPPYQDKFQEGDKITTLRKCLIGINNEHIYKWVEREPRYEQLKLF